MPTPKNRDTSAASLAGKPKRQPRKEPETAPAGSSFDPAAVAEALQIYVKSSAKGERTYLHPNQFVRGGWCAAQHREIESYLKGAGVSCAGTTAILSDASRVLEYVRQAREVRFAGELAGYLPGIYHERGDIKIITKGPRMIEPHAGDSSLIWNSLRLKFCNDEVGDLQLNIFVRYLQVAVRAIIEGRASKGPVLGLFTSITGAGKNTLQDELITPVLGGRDGSALNYLTSDRNFTGDLYGKEHWHLQDPDFSNVKNRAAIASKLKALVANARHESHAKSVDSETVTPRVFRVTISMNAAPDIMRTFPLVKGGDNDDKIIMLLLNDELGWARPSGVEPREGEDPSRYMWQPGTQEEVVFMNAWEAALPAFMHDLVHEWTAPADVSAGRFGVRTWQHPDLLRMMWEQEPVSQFAYLLDLALFSNRKDGVGWIKMKDLHQNHVMADHDLAEFCHRKPSRTDYFMGTLFKNETSAIAQQRGCSPKAVPWEDPERRYAKRHTNKENHWFIRPPRV